MQKAFTMNMKAFGKCLKTLMCLLDIMPHEDEVDLIFTDLDLKALLS